MLARSGDKKMLTGYGKQNIGLRAGVNQLQNGAAMFPMQRFRDFSMFKRTFFREDICSLNGAPCFMNDAGGNRDHRNAVSCIFEQTVLEKIQVCQMLESRHNGGCRYAVA
ncbi:MAG: hypothetical protein Q4E62_03710 [Sutterellaceae bacterium]|nr:hypothetical protein [Sutterellaceae bacterium]